MSKDRFETGPEPHISVESLGDLIVRGWAEAAVMVRGDRYEAEETKGGLSLRSNNSLTLNIPHGASVVLNSHGKALVKNFDGQLVVTQVLGDLIAKGLGHVTIEAAHGNIIIKNINGPLQINEVLGDLNVRNSQDLQVGSAHGDLRGRNINGAVTVGDVLGDISLRTVNGGLSVTAGHRDANLRNIGGLIRLDRILGDIRTRGRLAVGKHQMEANGDIVFRWPVDAPLQLNAAAPNISNKLPLKISSSSEGALSGRIGDGETTVTLTALGHIILKPDYALEGEFADVDMDEFDVDLEMEGLDELGDMISSQINNRMSEMASRIENKFGPDFAQKMAEKAARKAEQAVNRAVREVERTRKRAVGGAFGPAWNAPATPPPAPKTVNPEEQLQILRMLEKGIITTEEANTLLEALES